MDTFTAKEEMAISVLREQISQCRSDVMAYNIQFLASSAVTTIMAAFAAIFCTSSDNPQVWNIFYIFPTMGFLHLYNLIKYTNEQLQLGTYRMVLSCLVNQRLDEEILCWESKIIEGADFALYGGAVQIIFIAPIAIVMIWGYVQLDRNWLWYTILIILLIQCVLIVIMAFNLSRAKESTLKKLGYSFDDGKLSRIKDLPEDDEESSTNADSKDTTSA